MKRTLAIAACLFAGFAASAQINEDEAYNCFSIIAGSKATADGSVLFGHNEDDGGMQMLNIYTGENGIWEELPGMSVSDSFMNRNGVCIASDGCQSVEDVMDTTGKGVVYEVRVNVWKSAKTAREAVHIIGSTVEKYGYRGSGRTYAVADATEGWLVSVVKGRHWVAQRVPDDMVASIPNYYTITSVDLSDTVNFLGSKDLISYAEGRGWYNPSTDGKFNFRNVYGKPSVLKSAHNVPRHKAVIEALGHSYNADAIPFAVKCSEKIDVAGMRRLLSLHTEMGKDGKHPHCVCAHDTVVSTIYQLRGWMPKSIGCIAWICPGKVCAEVHVPWYLGMTRTPDGFCRFFSADEALQKHFSDGNEDVDGKSLRERYPDGIYWKYADRWAELSKHYEIYMDDRSVKVNSLQKSIFGNQAKFEKELHKSSAAVAAKLMNTYTAGLVSSSLK